MGKEESEAAPDCPGAPQAPPAGQEPQELKRLKEQFGVLQIMGFRPPAHEVQLKILSDPVVQKLLHEPTDGSPYDELLERKEKESEKKSGDDKGR